MSVVLVSACPACQRCASSHLPSLLAGAPVMQPLLSRSADGGDKRWSRYHRAVKTRDCAKPGHRQPQYSSFSQSRQLRRLRYRASRRTGPLRGRSQLGLGSITRACLPV